MRLKSEHMPLECGETDHTVSNSFQNDVFSAHFTFQEKKGGKEFLRVEGDIVIFKDIPKLKIVERDLECYFLKNPVQTRKALCRKSVLPCCLIIANICASSVSL